MAENSASASATIGFLTVLQETSGQLGGYLVTNGWGRPLEFRLSTAVQPNRVQQILYGSTLQSYICADLIGKTLVDKTPTPVSLIVTDCDTALDLRRSLSIPVAWYSSKESSLARDLTASGAQVCPEEKGGPLLRHPRYPADNQAIRLILDRLGSRLGITADGPATVSRAAPGLPLAQLGSRNLAAVGEISAALPEAIAQYGGWFRGIGSFVSLNGNAVAPGFGANSGGFLVGLDREVAPGVYLGGAAGYLHTAVAEHSTSNGDIDTGRIVGYGGGRADAA